MFERSANHRQAHAVESISGSSIVCNSCMISSCRSGSKSSSAGPMLTNRASLVVREVVCWVGINVDITRT